MKLFIIIIPKRSRYAFLVNIGRWIIIPPLHLEFSIFFY